MKPVTYAPPKLPRCSLRQLDSGLYEMTVDNYSDFQGIESGSRLVSPSVPDGVKLEFATSTSPITLSGSALNGSKMVAGALPSLEVITFTLATGAVAYVGPYTVADSSTTEQVTIPSPSGGTVSTSKQFIGALTITLPAQSSTAGRIKIGVAGRSTSADAFPMVVTSSTLSGVVAAAWQKLERIANKALRAKLGRELTAPEMFGLEVRLRGVISMTETMFRAANGMGL